MTQPPPFLAGFDRELIGLPLSVLACSMWFVDFFSFKPVPIIRIANALEVFPVEVEEAVDLLVERGYFRQNDAGHVVLSTDLSHPMSVRMADLGGAAPPPAPVIEPESLRRIAARNATIKLRAERFANGENACACCGRAPSNPRLLHLHHIVPIAQGGETTHDNLVMLCATCHGEAHDIDREMGGADGPTRTCAGLLEQIRIRISAAA